MTDAEEVFERNRKEKEAAEAKNLMILKQLSKNMSIIKNFGVDTDQIKQFSNIEEIDNYLLEIMQK